MTFKKTVLLLGMAASLSANAAMYQCKKGDVTIPCEKNAWTIGGDALYASRGEVLLATNAQTNANQSFSYDANWGLRVEAGRYFGTGNDFNINWTYLKVSQNFFDNAGGMYANGVAGQPFTESSYLSMVNLELGQHVDFGERWDIRFHGGMEITNYDNVQSTTTAVDGVLRDVVKTQLIGARSGANIAYNIWDALSFYSDGALGILYSSSRTAGPNNGSLTGAVNGGPMNVVSNGTTISVDYNIGLKYAMPVYQGDLITRVGWTAYSFAPQQGGISVVPTMSWQGLIFGAKWVGNA